MFQSLQPINRYYKNALLEFNMYNISQHNKTLTWLNKCILVEDNTMYCFPWGLTIFVLKSSTKMVQYMNGIYMIIFRIIKLIPREYVK